MRSTADLLDKVRATIVRQYVSKTGLPEADVEELMDAETWMGAEEAERAGFVDRLTDDAPVAACAIPAAIAAHMRVPEPLAGEPAAAGDTGANIAGTQKAPSGGSPAGGAGSASRAVCVQGQFLRY